MFLTGDLDGSAHLSNLHLAVLAWDTMYTSNFWALFVSYRSKHMDGNVNGLDAVFGEKPADFI
jgi:hypothetical protein